MNYLFAGTAIVWLTILGYVISISSRLNKLSARVEDLERRAAAGRRA